MVTRKPMVCESPGKRLVVQGKYTSPLVHPIWGKQHYCLIVFIGQFSIRWSFSKVQGKFKVQIIASHLFFCIFNTWGYTLLCNFTPLNIKV